MCNSSHYFLHICILSACIEPCFHCHRHKYHIIWYLFSDQYERCIMFVQTFYSNASLMDSLRLYSCGYPYIARYLYLSGCCGSSHVITNQLSFIIWQQIIIVFMMRWMRAIFRNLVIIEILFFTFNGFFMMIWSVIILMVIIYQRSALRIAVLWNMRNKILALHLFSRIIVLHVL